MDSILIGGSVRDRLRGHGAAPPLDLDFEIRHNRTVREISELAASCRPQKTEFLPYDILRLTISDFDIELAPPRREIFPQGKEWLKHKEFEAIIDPLLPPEKAWERRDFTVNAIGIDMKSEKLVDPFDGVKDLGNNLLRPCGPSFFCDPVRFIRLIRFRCQHGFDLHPETDKRLCRFNLKGLTPRHFLKESFKSPFPPFVSRFFDTVQQHSIPLPDGLESLNFLARMEPPYPKNEEEVLLRLIHGKISHSLPQLQSFARYAKMEESLLKRQWDFRQNLERLQHMDRQLFRKQLEEAPLHEFLKLEDVRTIKRLHRLWSADTRLHHFFATKDCPSPSLAKTLAFAKTLFPTDTDKKEPFPADLPHEFRSEFRIYGHLKRQLKD